MKKKQEKENGHAGLEELELQGRWVCGITGLEVASMRDHSAVPHVVRTFPPAHDSMCESSFSPPPPPPSPPSHPYLPSLSQLCAFACFTCLDTNRHGRQRRSGKICCPSAIAPPSAANRICSYPPLPHDESVLALTRPSLTA